MSIAVADAGSFRDPGGKIYALGGEIYRAVMGKTAGKFAAFKECGLLDKMIQKGTLVSTEEVNAKVPFISCL